MKVIIIGGGPAGMIAAMTAAKKGDQVLLLEKMKTLGRKLLITGKGRCNITSSLTINEFIENIPGNGRFLYSAFQNFTNQDIIQLLREEGLEVKQERGNRIFPITDKSLDVLRVFTNLLKKWKVEVKTNTEVTELIVKDGKIVGVKANSAILEADKVILATGGKSYPETGSTGAGYKLAEKIGHTITEIKPSLVPLEIQELNLCKELQGLSLKNVSIQLWQEQKIIYEDFGEMLFTHFGVSGPIIISGSAHLVRSKGIEEALKNKKVMLKIDLKPALSIEKLEERIKRDFLESKNKEFKNSLDNLLPKKLIGIIIALSSITAEKKVNEITKEERKRLVELLKNLTLTIKGFRDIKEAIITAGGIQIKEVNPKTMESKLIKGLYFAGEILDVDAYTGGFNLQIAYSTGYTAGIN